MWINRIEVNRFTVFERLEIDLSEGINVFIGENGTGKTHLMKLIYAACKASDNRVSFSKKLVSTFLPDDLMIKRLLNKKFRKDKADIKIFAKNDEEKKKISLNFEDKTKKWDAEVKFEDAWEKSFTDLESVFIPAKEILSNSFNLVSANERGNVEFDDTYMDLIHSAKVDISDGELIKMSKHKTLENIMGGKVFFDKKKDKFYLRQGRLAIEFNLISEGFRKFGILWQLINNGVLRKGSVLFWDEPESNINPIHIPLLVEILMELQRAGVQVFISTHDYTLSKYFDIKVDENVIKFHSLYKSEEGIKCESSERFKHLEVNTIRDTFIQLYKDEIEVGMK